MGRTLLFSLPHPGKKKGVLEEGEGAEGGQTGWARVTEGIPRNQVPIWSPYSLIGAGRGEGNWWGGAGM